MKHVFFALLHFLLFLSTTILHAQYYPGVGIGTSQPRSVLDIVATDAGILIPRVDSLGAVTDPDTAELVFSLQDYAFCWYDGTQWVCGVFTNTDSSSVASCPSGSIQVDQTFCIEQDERTSASWWDAATICRQQGGRLCRIDEWYHVCINDSSLGVLNMSNDAEWTLNSGSHGRVAIIGLSGCTWIQESQQYHTRSFRCCFDLD